MMARWHESLFPTLEELGIGFMAFSPLANCFLTGASKKGDAATFDKGTDYRAAMPQFTDEAVEKNQALVDLIGQYVLVHGATDAQISLAWMLDKKPYLVPIPGSRRKYRLSGNAGVADIVLDAREVAAIDAALAEIPMSDVFGGSAAASK